MTAFLISFAADLLLTLAYTYGVAWLGAEDTTGRGEQL